MKKTITLVAIAMSIATAIYSQNVGVGTTTPAAKLDITSTNSGILIPRIALTATTAALPVTSPVVSMMVYNTATAGSGATAVTPGFYYWSGTAWLRVIDAVSLATATTVSNTVSGNTLTTTVDGVTGTGVSVPNIYNADGTLTGTRTMTMSGNALNLNGGTLTTDQDASVHGITVGEGGNSQMQNTAVGFQALQLNSTGNYNTANGYAALPSNTTGVENTANGAQALNSNNTGTNNTATGFEALIFNTSGNQNTANGVEALLTNTTGNNNSAFGYYADVASGNLNNATAIGAYAKVAASNAVVIGSISGVNGASASANVGIGTTTPAYPLDVVGNTRTTNFEMTSGAAAGDILQSDASGNATWVTQASIVPATTNMLTNTTNTITSTVNGITATAPSVNTNALSLTGTTVTSTVNGVASNALDISPILNNDWKITGNSGTVDGTNFLGNTDNIPLTFRVNNTQAGRLDGTLLNAFYGVGAGQANTTGVANTAMGHLALQANTSGNSNSALGYQALFRNTSGGGNVAIGSSSLYFNTTGYNNAANGYFSLYYNTTGHDNTATGASTLTNNSTGLNNVANGSTALNNNTTGGLNTGVGFGSLFYNTTGSSNSANGSSTLFNNTTGNANTANGTYSLQANTTGGYNSANGNFSLSVNTTGYANTASGAYALNTNTTGADNTALGYSADVASSALTNATAIGANAQVGASNSMVLGSINGTNGATASTNVGIGTTTPAAPLHVYSSSATTALIDGPGNISLGLATAGVVKAAIGVGAAGGFSPEAAAGDLIIRTTSGRILLNTSNGVSNAAMALNGNNVGIGTSTPAYPLDVAGKTRTSTFAMTTGAAAGDILQSDASGNATWVTQASIVPATTHTLTNTTNTISSTVNGITATAPAVNTNALSLTGTTVTSTVNGVASNALDISGVANNIYNTDGTLTGVRTMTMSGNALNLNGGTLTTNQDASMHGITVGEGGSSVVNNTAVGSGALSANTTGIQNTALGYDALNVNNTGGANTAVGLRALNLNTSGSNNTATGIFTLENNTTGSQNTAYGVAAMSISTTGSNNTAAGFRALNVNTTGNNNTGDGYYSLSGTSSGSNNLAAGDSSGIANTTGSNNTYLGYFSNSSSGVFTNSTAVGANSYVGASNSLVLGSINGVNGATSSTNVGIGTTTPAYPLDVVGTVNSSAGYRVANAAATAGTYLRGNGTNFVAGSILASDLPSLSTGYVDLTSAQTAAGIKTWSSAANFSGGTVNMTNGTSNMLAFNGNGYALPSFTTSSAGTKLLLFPNESATAVDYAIGITNNTVWHTIPQATSTYLHAFYGGTTELMRIQGDGKVGIGTSSPGYPLDVNGVINAATGLKVAGGTPSTSTYLKGNGANFVAGSIQAADVPTLNQNTTGNAATVTTNANLTGPITSIGNTTSVAAQTGTGSTFAMSVSPTFTGTPTLPTGTIGTTQTAGTNNTTLATTAFVTTATAAANNIYNSNGNLTGARTVTMGGYSLNLTGGNVGIGTTSPATQLSNTSNNILGNDANGINANSIDWYTNGGSGYSAALYNAYTGSGGNGLAIKLAGTAATNKILDLSTGANNASGTSVMVVEANGFVGIGNNTPAYMLDIGGTMKSYGFQSRQGSAAAAATTANIINFYWTGSNEQAWVDGINVGTLQYTSDRRLKDRIDTLKGSAIDRVMALRPSQFYYKNVKGTIFTGSSVEQEGFIADELQAVIPSAVNGEKDGMTKEGKLQPQTVNVIPIVSVLTKAVQDQQKTIQALTEKVDALEKLLSK